MRFEPFRTGKDRNLLCDLRQRLLGVIGILRLLDEIIDAQGLENRAVPEVGSVWFGPAI